MVAGCALLGLVSVVHFARASSGSLEAFDNFAFMGIVLGSGIPFVTLLTLGAAPDAPPGGRYRDALLVTAAKERTLLFLAPLWYVIPLLAPAYLYVAAAVPRTNALAGTWGLPLIFTVAATAVTALNFRAALRVGHVLRPTVTSPAS